MSENTTPNPNNSLTQNQILGQFFTPPQLVEKCISLIKNGQKILEPSCGAGAFSRLQDANSVFIEIDKTVVQNLNVLIMDFFDYDPTSKFDTIIGNPPFVDNSLFTAPKNSQIPVRANLYLHFMEKCFYHLADHGEIIFVVPSEFIKLTSAKFVNELYCQNGTFTHYFDFGAEHFFENTCVNICIFRYEKDNFSHETETFNGKLKMKINNGIISLTRGDNHTRLGDLFKIKVGVTSGADKIFEHVDGDEFVFPATAQTGELRKMIYQQTHPDLVKHKQVLLARKIKKFTEQNWYEWGRAINFREGEPRIYVNRKSDHPNPFFFSPCSKWIDGVLALFPKQAMSQANLQTVVQKLNQTNWRELGFQTGDKIVFTQKSLQEALVNL